MARRAKVASFAVSTYGATNGDGSGTDSHDAHFIWGVPINEASAESAVAGDLLTFDGSEWVALPAGGDKITSFTGIAGTVEVGTSDATLTWHATYNNTVASGQVFWTGVATGSMDLGAGPFDTGTITGPFTSNTNGQELVVTLQVTFVDGSVGTSSQVLTFAASVVAGAAADPATPGQALYNTLAGENKLLRTSIGGTFAISCTASEYPVGAVLNSFGRLPTVKDQSGTIYTAISLGTSTITENGTSQTYNFFTWAVDGADATYTFS